MDTLILKSIELEGKHGVHEEERLHGNRFELDVTLRGSFRAAGKSDDLSRTVDYSQIEKIALEVMQGPSKHLIETLCLTIGDRLFEALPGVSTMELALRKLSPPLESPTAWAEIRMQWQR